MGGDSVPVLETHYIHIADVRSLPERVAALAKFKPPVALTKYQKGQFARRWLIGTRCTHRASSR